MELPLLSEQMAQHVINMIKLALFSFIFVLPLPQPQNWIWRPIMNELNEWN